MVQLLFVLGLLVTERPAHDSEEENGCKGEGERKVGNPLLTALGPPPESTCTRTGRTSCGHRWISHPAGHKLRCIQRAPSRSKYGISSNNVSSRSPRFHYRRKFLEHAPFLSAVTCEAVLQIGYTFDPESTHVRWRCLVEAGFVRCNFGTNTRSSTKATESMVWAMLDLLPDDKALTHEKQRHRAQKSPYRKHKNACRNRALESSFV